MDKMFDLLEGFISCVDAKLNRIMSNQAFILVLLNDVTSGKYSNEIKGALEGTKHDVDDIKKGMDKF